MYSFFILSIGVLLLGVMSIFTLDFLVKIYKVVATVFILLYFFVIVIMFIIWMQPEGTEFIMGIDIREENFKWVLNQYDNALNTITLPFKTLSRESEEETYDLNPFFSFFSSYIPKINFD